MDYYERQQVENEQSVQPTGATEVTTEEDSSEETASEVSPETETAERVRYDSDH